MKKYIKTKDGIYENNGLMQSNSTAEENAIIVCGGHFAIPVSKIIAQSDTIDELCDEFVFEKTVLLDPYESIIQNWKNNFGFILLDNIQKVYGAIWIEGERGEPILKSVAKMNDKGELELL